MRSLILHIGSHKTGTSSIQATLLAEKEALQTQGWTLFHSNPDGSPRANGNALPWVRFRPSRSTRVQGVVRRRFPEVVADAGENVIVSAETFSWLFSPRQIHWLANRLQRHFDQVRIIAYVRRQDQQAVSHYQQASKQDAIVAARYYQGHYLALPPYRPHLRAYLDYHARLSHWGDAFGDQHTLVRVFEHAAFRNRDVVLDFFEQAGFKSPARTIRQNESSGAQRTKLGHLVSTEEFSPSVWQTLMRHTNNDGKLLPARDSALQFYQEFRESNDLLNDRFKLSASGPVFNESFEDYPATANDRWDEDSANNAIAALLKGVRDLCTHEAGNPEALEQAAGLLARSSPDLSAQLRQMAMSQQAAPASSTPGYHRWRTLLRSFARRQRPAGDSR